LFRLVEIYTVRTGWGLFTLRSIIDD